MSAVRRESEVFVPQQIGRSTSALLESVYKEVLQQNPTLSARLANIKSMEENLQAARQAAGEAVKLEKVLVRTGIVRNGQRYYPKKGLIGSKHHGVDWQEGPAEALSSSEPQGKFGRLQDVYFAVQKGAELGLGKAGVFPLSPDTSSVVYLPEKPKNRSGKVKEDVSAWPAKYVYVEVLPNGKVIGRPSLTARIPVPPRHYIEKPYPLETATEYRIIIAQTDDVPKIASRLRVSEHIVAAVKDHFFLSKHIIQLGPNKEVKAFFTPINEIADLWRQGTSGSLSTAEEAQFRRLLAHEYVERELMEAGFPYHSRHEKAWQQDEDGDFWPQPTKEHYGAHALAPHQNVLLPPFFLWRNVLHLPADGLTLADDLSNLDELMKEIILRVNPP